MPNTYKGGSMGTGYDSGSSYGDMTAYMGHFRQGKNMAEGHNTGPGPGLSKAGQPKQTNFSLGDTKLHPGAQTLPKAGLSKSAKYPGAKTLEDVKKANATTMTKESGGFQTKKAPKFTSEWAPGKGPRQSSVSAAKKSGAPKEIVDLMKAGRKSGFKTLRQAESAKSAGKGVKGAVASAKKNLRENFSGAYKAYHEKKNEERRSKEGGGFLSKVKGAFKKTLPTPKNIKSAGKLAKKAGGIMVNVTKKAGKLAGKAGRKMATGGAY